MQCQCCKTILRFWAILYYRWDIVLWDKNPEISNLPGWRSDANLGRGIAMVLSNRANTIHLCLRSANSISISSNLTSHFLSGSELRMGETPKSQLHYLPAKIGATGPASVDSYFKPRNAGTQMFTTWLQVACRQLPLWDSMSVDSLTTYDTHARWLGSKTIWSQRLLSVWWFVMSSACQDIDILSFLESAWCNPLLAFFKLGGRRIVTA